MNLLPYRKYTYNSPLSENEIRNRLNCLTRAANAFKVKYYPNIKISGYNGELRGNKFDLARAIAYRNSFLPMISGTISVQPTGTKIEIKMRLHTLVMVFGAVFFGVLLFAVVSSFTYYRLVNPVGLVIPIGMLVGGYLFFTVPFLIEAGIAKKDMAKLFECQALQN